MIVLAKRDIDYNLFIEIAEKKNVKLLKFSFNDSILKLIFRKV